MQKNCKIKSKAANFDQSQNIKIKYICTKNVNQGTKFPNIYQDEP